MAFRKVQPNRVYIFDPVLLDQIDSRTRLQKGDLVRVVNLPECPKANTMGHAHVVDANSGRFAGLVCTNSLQPLSDASRIAAELKSQLTAVR